MDVYDCIVIGAGYAGLSATRTLFRAGKNVLLLEARDRVGGRSYTQKFEDGSYADNGAAFLGPEHTRMHELAKEYGIETYETHNEGRIIQYYRNKRKTYKGLIPALRLWELLDADSIIKLFEKTAETINLEEPWKSPDAEKWDSMTYDKWLFKKCKTKAARDMMSLVSGVLWGCEPAEISMLHVLWFSKSGKTFTNLCSTKDGAQDRLVMGGSSTIAWKIQEELASSIRMKEPVEKITQEESIVTVQTYNNTYKAKKVICAIPMSLTKSIHFSPSLPMEKRQLVEQFHLGALWKCYCFYPRTFWRDKFSGEVLAAECYLGVVFDVAPPESDHGVLMGFVAGHKARLFALMTPEERQKRVIRDLVSFFGEEARKPYRYHDYTMTSDEWATGCPCAYPGTSTWTTVGRHWKESFNNIHWAGTEYSTISSGYMEGAVRSGEETARAVLERLKTPSM